MYIYTHIHMHIYIYNYTYTVDHLCKRLLAFGSRLERVLVQ